MSTPSIVNVKWTGNREFDAGREGRPTIHIDGDGNAGPTPPDSLLIALATCVSVDVVDILAKRRTPVEAYNVEIRGERVDTIPRRFRHITLNISIAGAGIERAPAEHAIDLAVNKYCSVRDSLTPDIPVVWNLSLNEPAVQNEPAVT
ncbi:MAG: OsmC family protein [Gemmatimonadaceae bacterium]